MLEDIICIIFGIIPSGKKGMNNQFSEISFGFQSDKKLNIEIVRRSILSKEILSKDNNIDNDLGR